MRLSTYKIFIFSFFILLNYSLSQDECEDIGGFGGAITIVNLFWMVVFRVMVLLVAFQ